MNNAYVSNDILNRLISIVVELIDDATSRRFLAVMGYLAGIYFSYQNGLDIPFNVWALGGGVLSIWIISITVRDIVTTMVTKTVPEMVTVPTATGTVPESAEVPEVGSTDPVETTTPSN